VPTSLRRSGCSDLPAGPGNPADKPVTESYARHHAEPAEQRDSPQASRPATVRTANRPIGPADRPDPRAPAGPTPAAFARVEPDPGAGYVTPASVPPQVQVRTIVAGGMPGWQITLIALGAALVAATATLLLNRALAARRAAFATSPDAYPVRRAKRSTSGLPRWHIQDERATPQSAAHHARECRQVVWPHWSALPGRARNKKRLVGRTGFEPVTSSVSVQGSYLAGRHDLAMGSSGGKPGQVVMRRRCCHFCCHRPSDRRWVMSITTHVSPVSDVPARPRDLDIEVSDRRPRPRRSPARLQAIIDKESGKLVSGARLALGEYESAQIGFVLRQDQWGAW